MADHASELIGKWACRFCGHDEYTHNLVEGCTYCTCIATPKEAAPRTDADLDAPILPPGQCCPSYKVKQQTPPATVPSIAPDARQRLARHLFLTERTDEWAPREWDRPQHVNQQPYLNRADQILRIIAGKEN